MGTMKGVILGIAPDARIVDITHQVPPQSVHEAAYVLWSAVPYFPPGTVHVVVVDPGVGSQRRPIAVRAGAATFVGPDNGAFSYVLAETGTWRRDSGVESEEAEIGDQDTCAVLHLDQPKYWLPQVSQTFHGRDIFSPVAAHLVAGVPFEDLGSPIHDPITFPLPEPSRLVDGRIQGRIVHVDRFGNLISNLPGAWLAGRQWTIQIADVRLVGPNPTYTAVSPGEMVALTGSGGVLEVAVRNGSAAQRLGTQAGEPIQAIPHEME